MRRWGLYGKSLKTDGAAYEFVLDCQSNCLFAPVAEACLDYCYQRYSKFSGQDFKEAGYVSAGLCSIFKYEKKDVIKGPVWYLETLKALASATCECSALSFWQRGLGKVSTCGSVHWCEDSDRWQFDEHVAFALQMHMCSGLKKENTKISTEWNNKKYLVTKIK